MNIDSLKMFCLVIEEGSISQAARLNNVSQPAVTKQIHQMENIYGTLLFDRINGKLKLTEAGHALYPYAKEIVKEFSRSKETVQQVIGNNEQKLSLGASLTIGEYLLPELLGKFKTEYPNMNLLLNIGNTPSILEKLENDVIDIALVEGAVDNNSFQTIKFADDELIFICPYNHPWKQRMNIELQDLIKEHLIWRESTSGTRVIIEKALERYGVLDKIESYMELGSTQAIKSAVEAGLGISILPRITVAKELKHNELCEVKIQDFKLDRDLWLVLKPTRFSRDNVEKFKNFILSTDG
ncbi:LysR family transcriptional regulator [Oceanobacillus zhaokaii]|uniref:LysR family transcriptional regulator n=1 Tax=Oceanobacillus zhaokaii TaxID=2052660 RepID=A0A345PIP4_9BACI|nr:LysR family transcriptional regulator [Oceanobacillus zhaokaii]AXI09874.1 LysR family transcriptional regulator [Oceanobacillus zhaokaii]